MNELDSEGYEVLVVTPYAEGAYNWRMGAIDRLHGNLSNAVSYGYSLTRDGMISTKLQD